MSGSINNNQVNTKTTVANLAKGVAELSSYEQALRMLGGKYQTHAQEVAGYVGATIHSWETYLSELVKSKGDFNQAREKSQEVLSLVVEEIRQKHKDNSILGSDKDLIKKTDLQLISFSAGLIPEVVSTPLVMAINFSTIEVFRRVHNNNYHNKPEQQLNFEQYIEYEDKNPSLRFVRNTVVLGILSSLGGGMKLTASMSLLGVMGERLMAVGKEQEIGGEKRVYGFKHLIQEVFSGQIPDELLNSMVSSRSFCLFASVTLGRRVAGAYDSFLDSPNDLLQSSTRYDEISDPKSADYSSYARLLGYGCLVGAAVVDMFDLGSGSPRNPYSSSQLKEILGYAKKSKKIEDSSEGDSQSDNSLGPSLPKPPRTPLPAAIARGMFPNYEMLVPVGAVAFPPPMKMEIDKNHVPGWKSPFPIYNQGGDDSISDAGSGDDFEGNWQEGRARQENLEIQKRFATLIRELKTASIEVVLQDYNDFRAKLDSRMRINDEPEVRSAAYFAYRRFVTLGKVNDAEIIATCFELSKKTLNNIRAILVVEALRDEKLHVVMDLVTASQEQPLSEFSRNYLHNLDLLFRDNTKSFLQNFKFDHYIQEDDENDYYHFVISTYIRFSFAAGRLEKTLGTLSRIYSNEAIFYDLYADSMQSSLELAQIVKKDSEYSHLILEGLHNRDKETKKTRLLYFFDSIGSFENTFIQQAFQETNKETFFKTAKGALKLVLLGSNSEEADFLVGELNQILKNDLSGFEEVFAQVLGYKVAKGELIEREDIEKYFNYAVYLKLGTKEELARVCVEYLRKLDFLFQAEIITGLSKQISVTVEAQSNKIEDKLKQALQGDSFEEVKKLEVPSLLLADPKIRFLAYDMYRRLIENENYDEVKELEKYFELREPRKTYIHQRILLQRLETGKLDAADRQVFEMDPRDQAFRSMFGALLVGDEQKLQIFKIFAKDAKPKSIQDAINEFALWCYRSDNFDHFKQVANNLRKFEEDFAGSIDNMLYNLISNVSYADGNYDLLQKVYSLVFGEDSEYYIANETINSKSKDKIVHYLRNNPNAPKDQKDLGNAYFLFVHLGKFEELRFFLNTYREVRGQSRISIEEKVEAVSSYLEAKIQRMEINAKSELVEVLKNIAKELKLSEYNLADILGLLRNKLRENDYSFEANFIEELLSKSEQLREISDEFISTVAKPQQINESVLLAANNIAKHLERGEDVEADKVFLDLSEEEQAKVCSYSRVRNAIANIFEITLSSKEATDRCIRLKDSRLLANKQNNWYQVIALSLQGQIEEAWSKSLAIKNELLRKKNDLMVRRLVSNLLKSEQGEDLEKAKKIFKEFFPIPQANFDLFFEYLSRQVLENNFISALRLLSELRVISEQAVKDIDSFNQSQEFARGLFTEIRRQFFRADFEDLVHLLIMNRLLNSQMSDADNKAFIASLKESKQISSKIIKLQVLVDAGKIKEVAQFYAFYSNSDWQTFFRDTPQGIQFIVATVSESLLEGQVELASDKFLQVFSDMPQISTIFKNLQDKDFFSIGLSLSTNKQWRLNQGIFEKMLRAYFVCLLMNEEEKVQLDFIEHIALQLGMDENKDDISFIFQEIIAYPNKSIQEKVERIIWLKNEFKLSTGEYKEEIFALIENCISDGRVDLARKIYDEFKLSSLRSDLLEYLFVKLNIFNTFLEGDDITINQFFKLFEVTPKELSDLED